MSAFTGNEDLGLEHLLLFLGPLGLGLYLFQPAQDFQGDLPLNLFAHIIRSAVEGLRYFSFNLEILFAQLWHFAFLRKMVLVSLNCKVEDIVLLKKILIRGI